MQNIKKIKNGSFLAKFIKKNEAKIEVLVTWKFIHVIPYWINL